MREVGLLCTKYPLFEALQCVRLQLMEDAFTCILFVIIEAVQSVC